jgi:hypothetical protein
MLSDLAVASSTSVWPGSVRNPALLVTWLFELGTPHVTGSLQLNASDEALTTGVGDGADRGALATAPGGGLSTAAGVALFVQAASITTAPASNDLTTV